MPLGKARGSKRYTSTSYASTVTTIIFVTLCVLGVWMLASNSIVPPPQTTTRTATTTSTINTNTDDTSLSNSNDEQPTKPNTNDLLTSTNNDDQTTISKSESKNDQPAFEDNPGRLPDDAIKSDEPQKLQLDKKGSKEHSAVGENSQGLQGTEHAEEREKQRQGETQLSEESTMTQNQETEDSAQKSDDNSVEAKQQGDGEQGNGESTDQRTEKDKEDSQGESQNQKQTNENPMQESNLDLQKQTMKEYEKEQRQQREEDAGDPKSNTQDSQTDENKQSESQQDQQQEQERNKGQQQDSNAEVTFTDSTREEQPTEQGFSKEVTQTETPQNSTNEEIGQQQQRDQQQKEEQKQEDSEESNRGSTQEQTQETSSDESNSGESFPGGGNSGIPKESTESKRSWKTQATESKDEKQRQKDESVGKESIDRYKWHLCNTSAGPDYIPCLDNEEAIMNLKSRRHFEHRERHCPEDPPTCLVPLPDGYKESIKWPKSRDKIWYHNVPHTKLAEVKGHQNWVKVTGEFLTFPGGGTQFIHGALHYIDFLQQSVPNIRWGKHSRVILDVGCGVASFGGYLFERDVLAMSFAPKDEHEAQVQFALERGIPAISTVMGSQRLPFPSRVFDIVHCARCRVPWHNEDGLLLLELNRVLRPGGYFVWSATPVYQKLQEDTEIWNAMSSLTKSMCWEIVTIKKDKLNGIGAAIYHKPLSNKCYDKRQKNHPPMCKNDDDANAAWYVPLQACMHRVPVNPVERGSKWPEDWPRRLQTPPYWLNSSQMGIYGKPAPQDFTTDYEHWKQVVSKMYMNELGISWSNVRNVMDMRAVYGGFAAALKDLRVWVMNVVNINAPDTLPIIYERGLFGIYHDWCESFSTYPRSYDLLHADHLFSKLKERCKLAPVMAEVDRIVRPGGKLIVRDESNVIREVENLLKSLHWDVHLTFSKNHEGILSAQKGNWRPDATEASS